MSEREPEKLIKRHAALTHSENLRVISHVQRECGEWLQNTLMIEDVSVPFKYKRKKRYRDLSGARVNLTYYPGTETVAGMEIEIMNVVRIKRS
ncbi:MAG: hypothetical protein AAF385_10070 [Pseudomonadota bacterium]